MITTGGGPYYAPLDPAAAVDRTGEAPILTLTAYHARRVKSDTPYHTTPYACLIHDSHISLSSGNILPMTLKSWKSRQSCNFFASTQKNSYPIKHFVS